MKEKGYSLKQTEEMMMQYFGVGYSVEKNNFSDALKTYEARMVKTT